MYMSTCFISKKQAEAVDSLEHHSRVLISITSPPYTPGCFRANLVEAAWDGILRLEFHDVDPQAYRIRKEKVPIVLFDETHAIQILKFLKEHEDKVTHAVVHCEAGISRSAAVSKFIAQTYGLKFPESYSLYNKHVFSTMLAVYGKCLYGEGMDLDELPAISRQSGRDLP